MTKITDSPHFDMVLDTTGLRCPLPVLKLRKALKEIDSGKIIKCVATDEASLKDVADFCYAANHILINQIQEDKSITHYVKKGIAS